jgi:hypothetical protein
MTGRPDRSTSALSSDRRRFLAALGGVTAGLSGCLGLLETESITVPPVLA